MFGPRSLAFLLLATSTCFAQGVDPTTKTAKKPAAKNTPKIDKKAAALTPEELAEKAKPSVVVILHTGRQGKQAGLGTGFVVDGDGLIATNYHVIGEARPITVQMPDGTKHEVVSVHASDRHMDLAVIRIKAKGLKPLAVGDSDSLKNGQAIVALGHPQGLKYSIVAGVLSGRREVEGMNMLQVALPIEQGNSGGPVLDSLGRVVGIVTMKSLVTANLGFAVPSKNLKTLLQKPNPVAMDQWVTLGVLDKAEWRTQYGATWRQRAGRIAVDGTGTGFGGRSLCFWQREPPKELPYEITVSVRMDNESGAAGVFFGGDGGDRHYGFYPSSGKLRFTRFNGPDVYSWKILDEFASPHYRPGDWNTLKIRLEKDRAICFLNDQQVLDRAGIELFGSAIGLAKFRETVAEYKSFRVATSLAGPKLAASELKRIQAAIAAVGVRSPTDPQVVAPFLKAPMDSMRLLRERAFHLEKEVEQLRKLAQSVHQQRVLEELASVTRKEEEDLDLLRAALLIAKLDNEELETEPYVREVDRWAREIRTGLPKDADAERRLEALNAFLFKERGFHGSRHDYYSRNNSYLNEVIDDREGLPITLSILYLELARRLDLRVVGVPLPGHFVVRHEPKGLPAYLIDVFEGGQTMTNQEAEERIVKATGNLPKRKDFHAASKKAILTRMLHNLLGLADREKDREAMLRYLDAMLTIEPASHEERWVRAVFRYQSGRPSEAMLDCDYLLDHATEDDVDLGRVRELKRLLQKK